MKHLKTYLILNLLVCQISFGKDVKMYDPDAVVSLDSRIKTFLYNENEIFSLKFRIGYHSIIQFSGEEEIEVISVGDPYPWKMTPVDKKLFIEPIEPGVKTNMTIITNKRMYLFEIESDISNSSDDADIIYIARFFYPSNDYQSPDYGFLKNQKQQKMDGERDRQKNNISQNARQNPNDQKKSDSSQGQEEVKGLGSGLMQMLSPSNLSAGGKSQADSPNMQNQSGRGVQNPQMQNGSKSPNSKKLNIMYSFSGKKSDATPVEIFDDKSKTFVRFAKTTDTAKVQIMKDRVPLEYSKVGDFVVINGVYDKLQVKYLNASGQEDVSNVYNDVLYAK